MVLKLQMRRVNTIVNTLYFIQIKYADTNLTSFVKKVKCFRSSNEINEFCNKTRVLILNSSEEKTRVGLLFLKLLVIPTNWFRYYGNWYRYNRYQLN
jgi:hypothetical protein